jgi:hypothetical protein
MKKLTESELQFGDILIFENQDFEMLKFGQMVKDAYDEQNNKKKKQKEMGIAMYLLVYLIPWFDSGKEGENYKNIYHAAIWGNVDIFKGASVKTSQFETKIVQAGGSGIDSAHLYDTLIGHGVKCIHVYRRKEQPKGFYSKINDTTTDFYNKNKTEYSYNTAWLLAVLCSLRYSDGALYKFLKEKMGKAAADLSVDLITNILNTYMKDHQDEMVACSTLVAMIYADADYPLTINKTKIYTSELDFELNETLVTPRQIFESPDVHKVGEFHFCGAKG